MDKNGGKKKKIKCTKRKTKNQYVRTYHNNSYQRRLLLRLSNTSPIGPIQTHGIFIQILTYKAFFIDVREYYIHVCSLYPYVCM